MIIDNQRVVAISYKMYTKNDEGTDEELWEETPKGHPMVYCHGEGMMLPKLEEALAGKEEGDTFDFCISKEDAYGEYDPRGERELPKHLFYNGDGEFDAERVAVGNVVPMTAEGGQIVNALVVEITDTTVTIDLNHPLAGEDLHFVGKVESVREVTPAELDAIRHPHQCGHCKGKCHGSTGGYREDNECGGCGHCGGCDDCNDTSNA